MSETFIFLSLCVMVVFTLIAMSLYFGHAMKRARIAAYREVLDLLLIIASHPATNPETASKTQQRYEQTLSRIESSLA